MAFRRAPQEPVYQRDEPYPTNHHVGHTDTCGLVGLYTYILCLGGCGTYIDLPSHREGPISHFCPPCWEKYRPSDQIPTVAERRAQTAQYIARLERLQDRMAMPDDRPEPEHVYEPTSEEKAWAQQEIRRQKLAAGVHEEPEGK